MLNPCPSGIVVMPIDSLVNLKISGQRVVLVLIPPVLHLGRDISKGEDFAMGVGLFVRIFRDPFLARFPFNRAIVAKPIADEAEKATHPIPPCRARRGRCPIGETIPRSALYPIDNRSPDQHRPKPLPVIRGWPRPASPPCRP